MGKRACPNTIIDLTLKSDREQDSGLENVARRPNLKNSTKPTAKRSRSVQTTSSDFDTNSNDEVIVLDDDMKAAAVRSVAMV